MNPIGMIVAGLFAWVIGKIALPLFFPLLVGTISNRSESRAKALVHFYAKYHVILQLVVALAFMATTYWTILRLGVILGALAVVAFMVLVWVVTVLI